MTPSCIKFDHWFGNRVALKNWPHPLGKNVSNRGDVFPSVKASMTCPSNEPRNMCARQLVTSIKDRFVVKCTESAHSLRAILISIGQGFFCFLAFALGFEMTL